MKHFPRTCHALLTLIALAAVSCSSNRSPAVSKVPPPPAKSNEIRVTGAPNTIPPGTKLEVRTNEAITSTSSEGRTYSAQIATDVIDQNGEVLLPKGSPVELVLMETKQGGGIRGSSVQLGMRSVTVNGSTYLVISQEVQRTTGLGRNRRTAEMVGSGAALGTLIGAATGGGKGAVLGGLAGAAAGALAQILTQGKELRIAAETVLTFQLDEPVKLQVASAQSPSPSIPAPAASTP
ncbi:MAG: hypothetical protein H7039_23800 [Bryobacteraceae bacterium]|nr:hypothetical protein [Bryobacteraceae bacterium]